MPQIGNDVRNFAIIGHGESETSEARRKTGRVVAPIGTVVKAKKSEEGGAVVLAAKGRYRAESGGDDVRWLRFVRD